MNMREIYRKVARKHGVSVKEVKRDMQAAIEFAYNRPGRSEREKMVQESVERANGVPTVKELIAFAVGELREQEK
ncbi:sporulation initiation factor Spo0A C-terminal domain-containing protein [Desulfitobacterium chlororespirans]|uniref:Sporulation initiation factor Spo0A C terminal n=1 Tax=Desulfitobacterium chlororespirans DSM 11544 TaxID=1121395 RepID=A0A1M7SFT0_9FIRM|nr:sporulation initiation factor Spo0A C-terminal domain-containing protein [Desulfitobacterium chlororespirans]SHN57304.1 Sporulation initiation factor Spo0A C terminal [Desulfitobacterium chlororespirans DSM 11544]